MEQFDAPSGAFFGATVVLLNGPPRCGKDTAGNYLTSVTPRSRTMKFAGMLKRSTHMDFGLPTELPDDAFEHCKDEPHPAFYGLSPRKAYIQKSEERQKPFLGEDIYGRVLLRRMWRAYRQGVRTFFLTDSGFVKEAYPVVEAIGSANTLLVRIHAEERGKTFAGDSRSYINLPDVVSYDIENNESVEDFTQELRHYVLPFVVDRIVFKQG